MTTSELKGRFFLQNESIRIDSNRELECSSKSVGDASRTTITPTTNSICHDRRTRADRTRRFSHKTRDNTLIVRPTDRSSALARPCISDYRATALRTVQIFSECTARGEVPARRVVHNLELKNRKIHFQRKFHGISVKCRVVFCA